MTALLVGRLGCGRVDGPAAMLARRRPDPPRTASRGQVRTDTRDGVAGRSRGPRTRARRLRRVVPVDGRLPRRVLGLDGCGHPAQSTGRRRSDRPDAVAAPRDSGRRNVPRERKNPGDDLFSRKAALSVSSALESLTSVFGMGTGMASPPVSPGFVASGCCSAATAASPMAAWAPFLQSIFEIRVKNVDRSTMSQPLTPGQLL